MNSTSKIQQRFGTWESPIKTDQLGKKTIGVAVVGRVSNEHTWLERREDGRAVFVQGPQRTIQTPAERRIQSEVYSYGGGSFTHTRNSAYFVDGDTQQIFHQTMGPQAQARQITTRDGAKFANIVDNPQHQRLIAVMEEKPTEPNQKEPIHSLASIPLDGQGDIERIVEGKDFYAKPTLSPDGKTLAWLSWDHPNMSWDSTELWVATVNEDGSLGEPQLVSGGENESILEPKWSPDGTLYFVSDRNNGWWNLHTWKDGKVISVLEMEAEFTNAQWTLGSSNYEFLDANTILCSYNQNMIDHLAILDLTTNELRAVESPYTSFHTIKVDGDDIYFLAASPQHPRRVIHIDKKTWEWTELVTSSTVEFSDDFISTPKHISFETTDGQEAHGFYYAPTNPNFEGPDGEKPPLIVMAHGGPTDQSSSDYRFDIQYWTSRGFAVLDVNYRGSTGLGRDYRNRLYGKWGDYDIADCVHGALHLVDQGLADRDKLIIRGGSAGGFVVFAAMAFYPDIFSAGASYFGVSDVKTLASDTHKLESRYMERLVGSADPEALARISPINYLDRFQSALIILQGAEDPVVPPAQSRLIAEALEARGIPIRYLEFEGEKHGFRQAKNSRKAYEEELAFFLKVLGIEENKETA